MEFRLRDLIQDFLIRPVRIITLVPERLSLRGTQRVFAIGLSKTGTSSLTEALRSLGYQTRHFPVEMTALRGGRLKLRIEEASIHQCLTDTPVALFYQQLDKRFPGAKFILTVRDMDGWLKSCEAHFTKPTWGRRMDQLHLELYGSREFDRMGFAKAYERHVSGVNEFFRDRPEDLLVLNIGSGDGWEDLCAFLEVPVPEIPFPWANKTRSRVQSGD